ncbi:MAG: SDR family oxidoreductase [Anaerolineales bacterium]|nr:SDR family oxidoreductase [Anaerolineales bacterium]
MKLLILGGTRFLGRHLVEAALGRGHQVTLFNRGKSNPELFPQVDTILGNRNGDLAGLQGRQWDAVIDTCGYVPHIVRASAEALVDAVEHYTFISTISVYADEAQPDQDEQAALAPLLDDNLETVTDANYGPLKVLCEQAVQEVFPHHALIIRPGLIVGPHDRSDRFTYWPARLARGGQVLAPGNPEMPVQIIDVRDLAEWNIRLVEARQTGVYNAAGPEQPLSMAAVLATCQQVAGQLAELVWVSEEFLLAQQVAAFTQVPLWLPKAYQGLSQVNIQRALAAGLQFRPLMETVADTLVWAQSRPADYTWANGLSPAREEELLAAWSETSGRENQDA